MSHELSCSPAIIDTARLIDVTGRKLQHEVQQLDAAHAYLHAPLRRCEAWAVPPREQWPESWDTFKNPLAAYGLHYMDTHMQGQAGNRIANPH